MNYENELSTILKLRKEAYSIDLTILLLIAAGIGSGYISIYLAGIFGLLAFMFFYRKLIKAAHYSCPKCGENFGVASKWPLSVGGNHCQNCKLKLHHGETA